MGSGEGSAHWNVFDSVKTIPSAPEALTAEINSAISALEYAHATSFLRSRSSSFSKNKRAETNSASQYDAQVSDDAYKAGLVPWPRASTTRPFNL